jgi:hypothetical protein
MDQSKLVKRFVIGTFITLYTLVSVISTIHVIDFFELSNPYWLAVTLAIGFEVGAAASLASLVILDRMNKTLVWALFITITLMQMQGNMYYAFTNLEDFQSWSELFDLIEEEPIFQKRVLSAVSGAILPLVALGFIKSLVDYIKPQDDEEFTPEDSTFGNISEEDLERAEEDLDAWREEILDEEVDDTDQDFAYNDMEAEKWLDEEELKDWEETLNDGLEDEDFEFETDLLDLQDEVVETHPTEIEPEVEEVEDNEDLFEAAKRRLAREEMKDFLNKKRNDSSPSNRA